MSQSFLQIPANELPPTQVQQQQQQQSNVLLLTPNLPSWLIPIVGTGVVFLMVNAWPNIFYVPVVIGLCAIILLWLTQPYTG